ncbi:MAG: hypothetical protein KUG79_17080 [Pseudomonadales bacterium]|nr:hypothetical protein [Pseudomonadales bacterium]
MNQKQNWDKEDDSLQEEFLDIHELYQRNQHKPKPVSRRLDRLIRQQARVNQHQDLSKNWIFSAAVKLTLAILLLFSIGLAFVLID